MLIDHYLRSFDVTQVCETSVRALPSEVYEAMLGTDLRDPVVNALFAVRELPLRIARRLHREAPLPPPPAVTFGDVATGPIWVRLAEEPGVELVVGSIGRGATSPELRQSPSWSRLAAARPAAASPVRMR